MINGSHVIIYSTDPEADRAFFRDVLKCSYVDVGDGWLIFSLPPAELGVHPSNTGGKHEFYLMCDDIDQFVASMRTVNVDCTPLHQEPWGTLTDITLPGGGKVGVYQPRHARPD